jgi:hypothetical protein
MLFVDGENLSRQGADALRANGVELYGGPLWQQRAGPADVPDGE